MSFRAFLFATQAVMAEEGLSFHVETVTPEQSPAETRARNAESMQVFQGLMGGIGKRKR
jgi:hypothetical protein